MWKDPIVEQVRAARAALTKEWEATPGGIAARERMIFRQWQGTAKAKVLDARLAQEQWHVPAKVAENRAEYGKVPRDPIVAEVRRIRRQIAKECGGDVQRFSSRQEAVFAKWKGRKVTEPFHPEWHAPHAAAVAEERAKHETGKK